MHQRIRACGTRVEREPERAKRAPRRPSRRGGISLGGQVFGEGAEEHVSPLVTRPTRLRFQQPEPGRGRLMAILLQELGHQPPAFLLPATAQPLAQVGERRSTVGRRHTATLRNITRRKPARAAVICPRRTSPAAPASPVRTWPRRPPQIKLAAILAIGLNALRVALGAPGTGTHRRPADYRVPTPMAAASSNITTSDASAAGTRGRTTPTLDATNDQGIPRDPIMWL